MGNSEANEQGMAHEMKAELLSRFMGNMCIGVDHTDIDSQLVARFPMDGCFEHSSKAPNGS